MICPKTMELAVLQYKKWQRYTSTSKHVLSAYCLPGTLHAWSHLLFTKMEWVKYYYYFHFIWEFMAKQRETKLRSQNLDSISCLSHFKEWAPLTVKLISSSHYDYHSHYLYHSRKGAPMDTPDTRSCCQHVCQAILGHWDPPIPQLCDSHENVLLRLSR